MLINTIEALQQLYVALGGDIADVQNITITPEMISALTEVAAAAASELPAVKSADNGKVLTVVSGKWAKADAPTELPSVSGTDNGKLLGVSSGKWTKVNAPAGLSVARGNASGTTAGSNVSISLPSGVVRSTLTGYDGFDTVSNKAIVITYGGSIYCSWESTDQVGLMCYFTGIGKINNKLSKITIGVSTLQASNDVIYVEEITFS